MLIINGLKKIFNELNTMSDLYLNTQVAKKQDQRAPGAPVTNAAPLFLLAD
jgi:hypothetical protein